MLEVFDAIGVRKLPLVLLTVLANVAFAFWLSTADVQLVHVLALLHVVALLWLCRPAVRQRAALAGMVALLLCALLPYASAGTPTIGGPIVFGLVAGLGYWLFLPIGQAAPIVRT